MASAEEGSPTTASASAAPTAAATVHIYTDGSCVGNGREVCFAGVGVFYGEDDPRNVSQVLTEGKPSNQNAELQALFLATAEAERMLRCGEAGEVVIHTDSQYGINCVTTWYRTWTRNGWRTAAGQPVAHRGWIEPIALRLDVWAGRMRLQKIRAHVGLYGNEQADELARSAAERARDAWRAERAQRDPQDAAPQAVVYLDPRTRPRAATSHRADVMALGRTLVEVVELPREWALGM